MRLEKSKIKHLVALIVWDSVGGGKILKWEKHFQKEKARIPRKGQTGKKK